MSMTTKTYCVSLYSFGVEKTQCDGLTLDEAREMVGRKMAPGHKYRLTRSAYLDEHGIEDTAAFEADYEQVFGHPLLG